MKRLFAVVALMAAIGAMLVSNAQSSADDPKSVKEIMKAAHKGGDAILPQLKTALGKKKDTDWEKVQSKVKDLALLAGDLEKNEPKKGTKDSWAKLTKAYSENVGKLSAAAEKKDSAAALTALMPLTGSCMGCHSVHR
jgi:hypothetical protein